MGVSLCLTPPNLETGNGNRWPAAKLVVRGESNAQRYVLESHLRAIQGDPTPYVVATAVTEVISSPFLLT